MASPVPEGGGSASVAPQRLKPCFQQPQLPRAEARGCLIASASGACRRCELPGFTFFGIALAAPCGQLGNSYRRCGLLLVGMWEHDGGRA